MNIDRSQAQTILNIPYSVMFGIIINFSFKFGSDSFLYWAIPKNVIFLWIILISYYLLVWYVHNVILFKKKDISLLILSFWIISSWILGISIIIVSTSNLWKYLIIGFYPVIVGLYDLIASNSKFYKSIIVENTIWLLVSAFALIIGITVLVPTFFYALTTSSHSEKGITDFFMIFFIIFLSVRYFRFYNLLVKS